MTHYDIQDDFTRLPVAEIIAIRDYRDVKAIRCLCPYCGRTELHPWPDNHPQPGVVTATCGIGAYRVQTLTKGPA